MTASFIVRSDEGTRLSLGPTDEVTIKLTGENTGGLTDMFVDVFGPLDGPPLHVHRQRDEALYVLEGSVTAQIGDAAHELEKGDVAWLPRQVPHTFANLSDGPARVLALTLPGGFHRFFPEISEAMAQGEAEEKIAALAEHHDASVVGPPLAVIRGLVPTN